MDVSKKQDESTQETQPKKGGPGRDSGSVEDSGCARLREDRHARTKRTERQVVP